MSLIFWDTNLFIYLMEGHEEFGPEVVRIRQRMIARKDRLCTSALTLGEVLTGARLAGDAQLVAEYRSILGPPLVEIIPFDQRAADNFSHIRVDRSVKPPDAIQLACAAAASVDLFLTNDRRLTNLVVPGIQFIADFRNALL